MKKGFNISHDKKGFTLIELLAVIIILGVLMLIAIPSVTEYIATSRRKSYVATASRYVDGAMAKVNSLEYPFSDMNTTYYIPVECIPLERGGKSPYGNWEDAYVVVEFTGDGYNYYWTSYDDAGMGVQLIKINDLTIDNVVPNIRTIEKKEVGDATKIGVVDKDNCNSSPIISDAESGGDSDYDEWYNTFTPTSASCFAFDSATKTITKYYEYEDDDYSKPECSEDVVIPLQIEGVNVEHLADGSASDNVFYEREIRSIVFPKSLKTIGDYVLYDSDLSGILKLPKSVTSIGNYAFAEAVGECMSSGVEMIVFESDSNLKSIGNYAFASNRITALDLPKSVITIGNNAFYINRLNDTLNIPNSVVSIGDYAFAGNEYCYYNQIKTLIFEGGSNLDRIGNGAFSYTGINSTVTIPKSVTYIGEYVFYGMDFYNNQFVHIETLIFETGRTKPLTIGERAFTGIGLKGTLTIPNTTISIGDRAFAGRIDNYGKSMGYDNQLETLIFEPGGTSSLIIGNNSFEHNLLKGTLTIPKRVTSIGNSAFNGYGNGNSSKAFTNQLESLIFEAGSSLISIGKNAFDGNNFSGTLTIPKSVTSIGDYAFNGINYAPSSSILVNNTKFSKVIFESGSGITTLGTGAFRSNTITSVVNTTGNSFQWCGGSSIVASTNCSPLTSFATGTINITGTYARTVNVTTN